MVEGRGQGTRQPGKERRWEARTYNYNSSPQKADVLSRLYRAEEQSQKDDATSPVRMDLVT